MIDYSKKINPSVRSVKPSGIRRFFDIAAEIPDAISLGVGEPDFVTPWNTRSAAINGIRRGHTAYTSNRGLKELRAATAEYLNERFGLDYNPDTEMFVTVGASEAIDLALRTLVTPGDGVLVPDPSYVSYVPGITLAGGVPVPVTTRAEDDFRLTVSALESAYDDKCKVLILPYPNNPTGAIMPKETLESIAGFAKRHDLMIISDEIYAELTYDGTHASICAIEGMKERSVLISGFSKAFAMTGWRIGYVAAPREITDEMLKIHQYTIMCAPTFSQHAAYAALTDGKSDGYADVEYMREQYDMRRRFLVARLRGMGLDCFEPKGAFYVFPSVLSTGMDGTAFAENLLKSKHVAVVPGDSFGAGGKYFVRCSYACSLSTLKTACERIEEYLKR